MGSGYWAWEVDEGALRRVCCVGFWDAGSAVHWDQYQVVGIERAWQKSAGKLLGCHFRVRRFVLGSVMSFQTLSSKVHVVISSCVEARTALLCWDLVSRGLDLGSCVLRRFACTSVSRAQSASVVESGFWDLGFRDFPYRHCTFRRGQLRRQTPIFQFQIPDPRALLILKEASMSGVFDDQSVVGIWDLGFGFQGLVRKPRFQVPIQIIWTPPNDFPFITTVHLCTPRRRVAFMKQFPISIPKSHIPKAVPTTA
jgi:hypothetical protein